MNRLVVVVILILVGVAAWTLYDFVSEQGPGDLDSINGTGLATEEHLPRRSDLPLAPKPTDGPIMPNEEIAPNRAISTPDTVKPLEIVGRLVDESNQPIAGSYVKVASSAAQVFQRPLTDGDVQTGVDGRFRLTGVNHNPQLQFTAFSKKHQRVRRVFSFVGGESHDLGTLVAKRGAILKGVVVDGNGLPASHALIEVLQPVDTGLYSKTMSRGIRSLGEIRTDQEGRFLVEGLTPGPGTVNVQFSGFAPIENMKVKAEYEEKAQDVRIELKPGRTIHVVVKNANGQPVAGASIGVDLQQGVSPSLLKRMHVDKPTTDSEGRVSISRLPIQELKVSGFKSGFMKTEAVNLGLDQDTVILTMNEAAIIFGYLVEAQTGKAIVPTKVLPRGMRVGLTFRRPEISLGAEAAKQFELKSAPNLFVIHELPGSSCEFKIKTDGFATLDLQVADLIAGEKREVEAETSPALFLTGVVLDIHGQALESARVRLVQPKEIDLRGMDEQERLQAELKQKLGYGPFSYSARGKTDREGTFHFTDLSAGSYQLSVKLKGYLEEARIDIHLKANAPIEGFQVVLSSGATLAGVVFDGDNKPLPGTEVRIRQEIEKDKTSTTKERVQAKRYSTVSGIGGSYEITGIEPGVYVASFSVPPATRDSRSRMIQAKRRRQSNLKVTLVKDQTVKLDHKLTKPARIFGAVRAGGRPIEGASIQESMGDKKFAATRIHGLLTDKDGTYDLNDLEPGHIKIRVKLRNSPYESIKTVELKEGQQAQVNFNLPGGSISGVVVDGSGAPLADARVYAKASFGTDEERQINRQVNASVAAMTRHIEKLVRIPKNANKIDSAAKTGSDGRYQLSYVEAGNYDIYCEVKGYPAGLISDFIVVKNQANKGVDFQLVRGCDLTVLVSVAGAPATRAIVLAKRVGNKELFRTEMTDKDGSATLKQLVPGNYILTCRAGDKVKEKRVTVVGDASKTIEFNL